MIFIETEYYMTTNDCILQILNRSPKRANYSKPYMVSHQNECEATKTFPPKIVLKNGAEIRSGESMPIL